MTKVKTCRKTCLHQARFFNSQIFPCHFGGHLKSQNHHLPMRFMCISAHLVHLYWSAIGFKPFAKSRKHFISAPRLLSNQQSIRTLTSSARYDCSLPFRSFVVVTNVFLDIGKCIVEVRLISKSLCTISALAVESSDILILAQSRSFNQLCSDTAAEKIWLHLLLLSRYHLLCCTRRCYLKLSPQQGFVSVQRCASDND